MSNPLFRNLPSVNELLESPPLRSLVSRVNRNVVVTGVARFLDTMREDLRAATSDIPAPADLAERIASWIVSAETTAPRPAINATGVILHAELGGAPLADEAIRAVTEVTRGYAFALDAERTGRRGTHDLAVESLLCEISGAEAAAVFHQGPGALLTTLASLGAGRDVVVSRGDVLEIDGVRLPDLAASSRTRLREVGTTNRTELADFAAYASPETGLFLTIAPTNFAIQGDHGQPDWEELVALGRAHAIPVVADLGLGGILSVESPAVASIAGAASALRKGVDVCLIRGNKLFGGPACGLVLGRRKWIEQLVGHPLRGALRIDPLSLAALDATLRLYASAGSGPAALPVHTLLNASVDNLRNRAERLGPQFAAIPGLANAEPLAGFTPLASGGGCHELPTWHIALSTRSGDVAELAAALRRGSPAVIGRPEGERLKLDLRSVLPRQDLDLVAAVQAAAGVPASSST